MLIHGDCLDVLHTLPDASVDMVFADLPYAHNQRDKVRRVTRNAWDNPVDLHVLWQEMLRIGKTACVFAFTATQPFVTALINSQPDLFRYDIIWTKKTISGFLNAKKSPLRAHEHILVFYKKTPTYHPQMTQGHKPYSIRNGNFSTNYGSQKKHVSSSEGQRYPVSHMYFLTDAKGMHPTQKPVALLEWLIRTYTNEGDTVLDPTCGSGTTAIAAINTNRKWVCIEKDATYHATAAKRIAEATSAPQQQAMAL